MKGSTLKPLSLSDYLKDMKIRPNLGIKIEGKKTNFKIQDSNLIIHQSKENENIQLQSKKMSLMIAK